MGADFPKYRRISPRRGPTNPTAALSCRTVESAYPWPSDEPAGRSRGRSKPKCMERAFAWALTHQGFSPDNLQAKSGFLCPHGICAVRPRRNLVSAGGCLSSSAAAVCRRRYLRVSCLPSVSFGSGGGPGWYNNLCGRGTPSSRGNQTRRRSGYSRARTFRPAAYLSIS